MKFHGERFEKFPVSEVTAIPETGGLYNLYKNYFWAVDENDNIFRFRNLSFVCNQDERIVKMLLKEDNPNLVVKKLENVWISYTEEGR